MSRERRQGETGRRSDESSGDEGAREAPRFGGPYWDTRPTSLRPGVEGFEEALIEGAGGVQAPLEDEARAASEPAAGDAPELGELPGGGGDDRRSSRPGGGGRGGGGGRRGDRDPFGRGEEESGGGLPAPREQAHAPRRPLPSRALAFSKASWAELQRVQWPDRREVWQATAVVLGFVAVAGIYLGVADWVAEHIIKAIL